MKKQKRINWQKVEADLKSRMLAIKEKLNQWTLQHPEWRVECFIHHRCDAYPDPASIICVFEMLASSRPDRDTLGDGKTFIGTEEVIMVGKFMGSINPEGVRIKYLSLADLPKKNIGDLEYQITLSDYAPYQKK